MTGLWDQLEGVYLAGEYALQQYLGSEGTAAFFQTTFGPDQRQAVLKLLPEHPAGEEQLARWRRVFELSHPHLLALLDCGRTEVGDEPFVYAVFERPDDSLAGAIANGPLSEEETRDVLNAALDVLRYLHEQELAHSAVEADHIVAVGDNIKLASDTVRQAGDAGASRTDDIYALGALLYELRTGWKVEPGLEPELATVSEPLATIIRHALDPDSRSRWTVQDISAALTPPEVEPAAPPAVFAEPIRAAVTDPQSTAKTGSPLLELPKRSPAMPLLVSAVGAVVVAVVLAVTQRSTPPEAPSTAISPVSLPATAAAQPVPAATIPSAMPRASTSAAPEPRPAVQRPAAHPREAWRVIAYTYNHREHAEHKVQTVNRKMPGFHAVLFTPKGPNQAPFFVALGGRLSREDAVALQKKAVAKGLPRDTFVRNFSE